MRIVLVNQYYVPDLAPTARYLGDLARQLMARGHEVSVVCSRRSYAGGRHAASRETSEGVKVRRLPAFGFGRATHVGRSLDYASFYLSVVIFLIGVHPRPDVIVSLTTPPFLGMLGCAAARLRRCVHVQWVMDVYPDVMLAHGMIRERSLVCRGLRWLSRRMLRCSSLTLTLGPDMAKALRTSAGESWKDRIRWIPLWVPGSFHAAAADGALTLRRRRGWDDTTVVFLYSGNMGLGHSFEEFLQAACRWAEREKPAPIRMVFAGEGRRRVAVEAFAEAHRDAPIELLPYAGESELAAHLASADVLLLSLDPAWSGCLLPSKIQTACASGRPVLFVGPTHCITARWIAESGAGWVSAPGDVEGLLCAMTECCVPAERRCRAARAVAFARKHFDAERNTATMCEMIASATQDAEPGTRNAKP